MPPYFSSGAFYWYISPLTTYQLPKSFTVADSSGNNVQEILHDSFGKRVYNSNPEHDLVLGFAGGLFDPDTGLIHFGYDEYVQITEHYPAPARISWGKNANI